MFDDGFLLSRLYRNHENEEQTGLLFSYKRTGWEEWIQKADNCDVKTRNCNARHIARYILQDARRATHPSQRPDLLTFRRQTLADRILTKHSIASKWRHNRLRAQHVCKAFKGSRPKLKFQFHVQRELMESSELRLRLARFLPERSPQLFCLLLNLDCLAVFPDWVCLLWDWG